MTSRPLDIPQALKYPWRHAEKMLVIPGVLFLVYFIVYLGGTVGSIFLSGVDFRDPQSISNFSTSPSYLASVMTVSMACMFLFFSPVFGFIWELAEVLRRDGYDTPPPAWGGNFLRFWQNGIKFFSFSFILFLPLTAVYLYIYFQLLTHGHRPLAFVWSLLVSVGMSVFIPFVYGAMIAALPDKSLKGLFNLPAAIRVGCQCYGKAMLAAVIMWILIIVAYPVSIMLGCCTLCIGYFALYVYLMMAIAHLFIQAFDGYRPA